MGFQEAAVLGPVSFFLGVFFICFNVDHRLLWPGPGGLSEEVVKDGFQFYTTFYNAPPAIKGMLHGMVGMGFIGFMAKLQRWDESAVFFDGGSLALFVLSIVVYLTVTIPALRTIVDPVVGVDTRGDQVEAMRVLAAGNVIVVGLLGAILALQAGQEWARRTESKEREMIEKEEREKKEVEKKGQ